jgi:hypothetical protein
MERLREDLLRTLGVGEWEAEGLTLLDLTRRLIELCDWQAERLQAQSHECAGLACDIQELLSGEAWDRQREELFHLGEEVAELAKENAALRRRVQELGVCDKGGAQCVKPTSC